MTYNETKLVLLSLEILLPMPNPEDVLARKIKIKKKKNGERVKEKKHK